MDKHAVWKWLILIGVVAASLALVTPPLDKKDAQGSVVRPGKIKLGLDLQGGTSYTVQLDEDRIAQDIKARSPELNEEQVKAEVANTAQGAQGRTLEILRSRVDNLGIAEPVLYPTKNNRIVVQLPGITKEQREKAEDAIKRAAFLEFRMVHENSDTYTAALFEKRLAPEGYRIADTVQGGYYKAVTGFRPAAGDEDAYRERLGRFNVPDSAHQFMLEKATVDGQVVYRPYFVKRRREMSGEYLRDARVDYQVMGQPVVAIRFDARGTTKFAQITGDYAPGGPRNPSRDRFRLLGIVLDDRLYSAPRLIEPIFGGRAEISGSFSVAEATFLANVLRAGALPAPVKIVERRVVDPSLGRVSARSGIGSGVYGCMAVVLLVAAYYWVPGLIANFALFMNVILLPLGMIAVAGFLGVFSGGRTGSAVELPVLTLPGIAGIALTIGMAIDANVLIFERMREEMRLGKGFAAAVQYGYDRAFSAILDSNLTTIITAVILFILGSGPIRGYAVTLTAGLIVSLFTAVVVTRMVFNVIGRKKPDVKLLKMAGLFPVTRFDLIVKWKLMLGASVALIVVTWGLMVTHGVKDARSVFGVDFMGGSAVTLSLDAGQKPGVDEVRGALAGAGVRDATIQYQSGGETGDRQNLDVKVATMEEGTQAAQALIEKFPAAKFEVMQQDDIGPQIGRELKVKAGWAMLWALVAMAIYISWRFEWGFAVGAFFSLLHDVLVTAGICHLLGFPINMAIVAALLTIVGYSVNDTIVIFDRIRENLRMVRGKSFVEICNQSINETLGRTFLTTFLTLVVVGSLVLFGGGAIRDFSVCMLIGMLSGVYSTVYIATPLVLLCYRFKTPEMGKKQVV